MLIEKNAHGEARVLKIQQGDAKRFGGGGGGVQELLTASNKVLSRPDLAWPMWRVMPFGAVSQSAALGGDRLRHQVPVTINQMGW